MIKSVKIYSGLIDTPIHAMIRVIILSDKYFMNFFEMFGYFFRGIFLCNITIYCLCFVVFDFGYPHVGFSFLIVNYLFARVVIQRIFIGFNIK